MDIQKFITKLPSLYENWGQDTINPISKEFEQVLNKISAKTTPNLMQLLNCGVECLDNEEIYCEIGCDQGVNLIGALLNNSEQIAYAVDNLDDDNFNQLTENLTKFNVDEQVFFCQQDFEEFFADLNDLQPDLKIGIYFYNGKSDYRSVLLGLLLVQPFLSDQALIIVNNSNYTMVQQGNYDFLNSYEECNILIDLPSPPAPSPKLGRGDEGVRVITIFSWDINQEINYSWQEIENKYRNPLAISAISNLHLKLEFEQKPAVINSLMAVALELNKQEKFDEAIDKYKEALIWHKYNPYICNNIASLYFKLEKYQDALDFAQVSVNLDSTISLHQFNLGKILEKLGEKEKAITVYEKSIKLNPDYVESYLNLGNLLLETNQLESAELIYQKNIELDEKNVEAYLNWGEVLVKLEKYEEAIKKYQKALELKPKTPEILEKIGNTYAKNNNPDQALLYSAYVDYRQEKYTEALPKFEAFFVNNQGDGFDHVALADCYEKNEQVQKAREIYLKGLENNPNHEYLYLNFLCLIHELGETEEDLKLIDQYAKNNPNNLTIQLEVKRFLPVVYKDIEEITFYKNKFQEFLNYLDEIIKSRLLADPHNLDHALNSIKFMTNFRLQYQYQYQIYKDQQKKYGDFVYYVMGLKYPQWVKPLTMPSLTPQGKIKIGYLSDQIGNTSASKWIIGWLQNCDRNKFEIYLYASSKRTVASETTNEIRKLCDYAYYIADDLEAISSQILQNELHILVFLAIGMFGATTQLASLRLAPIQCSTWGHPSTSGLPTIDYFLSGELLESSNAQEHYTEELIRLPNIGISYPKPKLAQPTKTRSDFNFSDDKIIYLSCQLSFKYLPQYDYIYPEIALRVPNSQFVFVCRTTGTDKRSLIREEIFYNRLQKVFDSVNLNVDEYCIFLPNQNKESYASLLNCSDVFLDTFAFCGGHTTFDAITFNLPILTCPGELMLGRQSYGILKMLGIEETIAYNEQEYIDIAVKLGLDSEFRNSVKEKIKLNQDRLFEDEECVKGLETFYQKVVTEKLAEQGNNPLTFSNFIEQTDQNKKKLLHVGCGGYNPNALPKEFSRDQWLEIRLDINPDVKPDIIGTITDLSNVPDNSVDAIYSSHNLEHIESHEVPVALAGFYRVLKLNGLVFITLPDIQKVAEYVSQGKLEETLYISPAGPICAIDILYGLRTSIQQGNYYMAHRTAFTAKTLEQKLIQAGFKNVNVIKDNLNLFAKGYKL